jgi:tRNA threonylcarbamoyladenosine biosynthesis protein TsaB
LIVLGLDTSTTATAVALRVGALEVTEARDDPRPGEHPGHATRLLAMADALLRARGLEWSALERVAVGTGPGGFTGLRVGLASARGLAHSLGCELVGVSSLAALALGALAQDHASAIGAERVLAVIDARRGEVFVAAYERTGTARAGEDAAGAGKDAVGAGGSIGVRELSEPRVLAPERVEEALARLPGSGFLAVGDGALRYALELERDGVSVAKPDSPVHLLRASAVCALGAGGEALEGLEALVPRYLRRPDAELAFKGARSGRALRA